MVELQAQTLKALQPTPYADTDFDVRIDIVGDIDASLVQQAARAAWHGEQDDAASQPVRLNPPPLNAVEIAGFASIVPCRIIQARENASLCGRAGHATTADTELGRHERAWKRREVRMAGT